MANTYASQKYGNLNFSGAIGLQNIGNTVSGAYFTTPDKKVYQYIPQDVIEKGVKEGNTNYYLPYFLDTQNLNNFGKAAEYVDLSKLPYGDALAKYGVGAKGFLIPAELGVWNSTGSVPTGWGDITGLAIKDGQVAYATTGRAGDKFGWVTNSGVGAMPTPHKSGGLLGYLEGAGNALISAGPVIQLMAAITANPVLYGLAAGTAAGQGNLMGAALNLAGAAGSIPGIDAATAADLKATQSVLQISNAIKNDNPIAALTALGGLSGTAVPPEVVRGAQLLALNDALQKGDMKSLAVAVGNISNTPEISYAGKAAKVLEAIDSGNINKVTASLYGLLPELRSGYKSTDFKQAFAKVGADLTEDQFAKLDQMLGTTGEQLVNASMAGIAETQAQAEGWSSAEEAKTAQDLGFATPAEYQAYTASQKQAEEEAQAAADAKAQQEAIAAANAKAAADAQAVIDAQGTQDAETTPYAKAAADAQAVIDSQGTQDTETAGAGDQEKQPTGGLPTSGATAQVSYPGSSTAGTTGRTTTQGALPTATRRRTASVPSSQYWQFDPSIGLPDMGFSPLPGTDTTQSMLKPVDITGQDQGTTPMAGTGQPGQTFEPGSVQQLAQLFGSLAPEMKNVLLQRGNVSPDIVQAAQNPYAPDFGNMGGGLFASGGTVGSTISNVQDALSYKPIAPMVEPMLKAAPVSDTGVAKLKALKHLRQSIAPSSPLSLSEGLARGGLPSKYHEAMPDGHKPEFVTGLTGYYAGGRGTGQSDDIDAMLHDGDYVMDAEAVSALGDGSSKAGKDALTHFLGQVPHRDGATGKPVPAKIADGEFVLPESFVTALGGGDNKRGAKMLDEMRERLRSHKRAAPTSKIPPKAKSPLEYLEGVKG